MCIDGGRPSVGRILDRHPEPPALVVARRLLEQVPTEVLEVELEVVGVGLAEAFLTLTEAA
jgi:hypothetical protein